MHLIVAFPLIPEQTPSRGLREWKLFRQMSFPCRDLKLNSAMSSVREYVGVELCLLYFGFYSINLNKNLPFLMA